MFQGQSFCSTRYWLLAPEVFWKSWLWPWKRLRVDGGGPGADCLFNFVVTLPSSATYVFWRSFRTEEVSYIPRQIVSCNYLHISDRKRTWCFPDSAAIIRLLRNRSLWITFAPPLGAIAWMLANPFWIHAFVRDKSGTTIAKSLGPRVMAPKRTQSELNVTRIN